MHISSSRPVGLPKSDSRIVKVNGRAIGLFKYQPDGTILVPRIPGLTVETAVEAREALLQLAQKEGRV